ncbi:MAG: phytanoyl-CoA dioxygenase family protein [Pseudomonadota bacterium]
MSVSLRYLRHPLQSVGVFGTQKSFARNVIIGDAELNRQGLHRWRVGTAARLAERRRASIARTLSSDDVESFERNGFFVTENFLPDGAYQRFRDSLFAGRFPSYEMRQGATVTRMTPIGRELRAQVDGARELISNDRFRAQLGYAAGRTGAPLYFIQTVIADGSSTSIVDPQTMVHADTFHATSKAWLFLQDVGPDNGPFQYVPGSHKLTPERLAWEYEQSLTASCAEDVHHRAGSFRLKPGDLDRMKLPQPKAVTVKANTLVVADTFGFHARTPSSHPTTRVEFHGHLRRNPFLPWNGVDPLSLPVVRNEFLPFFQSIIAGKSEAADGKPREEVWHPMGAIGVADPANV